MARVEKLNQLINDASKIVFFGGAGVSTESGIPDYRSVDGLYSQKYNYPPETILSHDFFMTHTEEFYEFYKNKFLYLDAQPNAAHQKLAELEKRGKLNAVITQNVDNLHQKAGSKNVLELHGSVMRNYCMDCGEFYDAYYIKNAVNVPRCTKCGGIVKPDVVLYQEPLDDKTVSSAISAIKSADMMIIGGTSLNVYPAASLVTYFKGGTLALINKSELGIAGEASLVINENIGRVFSAITM